MLKVRAWAKEGAKEISNYYYDGIKNSETQVLAAKDGY